MPERDPIERKRAQDQQEGTWHDVPDRSGLPGGENYQGEDSDAARSDGEIPTEPERRDRGGRRDSADTHDRSLDRS